MAIKKNKEQINPKKQELEQETPPNNPKKYIPVKKDDDSDHISPKPGVTDPEKADPKRIEEPEKTSPTRIDKK